MSQPQQISRRPFNVLTPNRLSTHTTPFPNQLFDTVMPTLKDTEWKLLCVIVRQTLGWHDKQSGGRKERDWITRSQLIKKTGRNSAALSRALEVLVKRELIEVNDGEGRMLLSPLQRRQARGRVTYALHAQIGDGKSQGAKSEHETTNKSPKKMLTCSLLERHSTKCEHAKSPKANRTKETLTKQTETKENVTKRVFFQNNESGDATDALDSLSDEERVWSQADFHQLPTAMQQFIALYSEHYARYFPNATVPVIFTSALKRLERVLAKHSKSELAELLNWFFVNELAHIKRQWYSLESFVHNIEILQEAEDVL